MTLVPAYGRDYKTKKEVFAAFDAGKDFQIASIGPDSGRYVNKPQIPAGTRIVLRYKKLTQVATTVVK